ncbi:MAG TPA: phosphoenolpyruvate--protein phosphotransferase [Opitutales bacterium]|nr:phosphoenolpyruvate--protein phosphotransferase [Opitutales bacterium]
MNPSVQDLRIKGIPASAGVAHGRAVLLVQNELDIPESEIDESDFPAEIERFERALLDTRAQISKIRNEVAEKLGEDEANIFDAHLLVIEDKALIDETIREMETSRRNIVHAFHVVSGRYIDAFARIDDEYLRERATDIRDVSRRLLQNLMGIDSHGMSRNVGSGILVCHDISPSETASLEEGNVQAIVTDVGSRTSHAVIMARSIEVPAVVGLRNFSKRVRAGDRLLVDGYEGVVIVNPSQETLQLYGQIEEQKERLKDRLLSVRDLPAVTRNGRSIPIRANVESADNLEQLMASGAQGVGLFRTEYLYMANVRFPAEEEQFQVYRKVAETMAPDPVVIRTIDLGADKMDRQSPYHDNEANPFLGFRAIRFCLEFPEIFKDQLRAILRASHYGKIRMMYPMISGVDELSRANELLQEVREELDGEGIPYDKELPVGCMIEVPSAALCAEALAKESDFFSIGTNDLIQYLLAIDRLNDRIAHLYEPTHPAVLKTIQMVVDAAHSQGIPVGVCGEMAGDPIYLPLLLGLGVDEISVGASALAVSKYLIRKVDDSELEDLVKESFEAGDAKKIFKLAEAFFRHHVLEDVDREEDPE